MKRLIGLPGEWIQLPASSEVIKVPQGHCWVEGDNAARSWDSRSFGPVSYFISISFQLTRLAYFDLADLGKCSSLWTSCLSVTY